ncbi:BTB/POZ domain-containing protein KCTD9-like isoform X2 [Watersipora subatra]|uniref:BTB/POZ domain-containing protein KCTD9-like isoform X2 n=1 Tax=Watersipora subatra TaxID=2589382 RepID=UPI00355B44F5
MESTQFNKCRISVFKNGDHTVSCVLLLCHSSLEELMKDIAILLNVAKISLLFNNHGALIRDIQVIRDEDVVYAAAVATELFEGRTCLAKTRNLEWITLNIGGYRVTTTKDTLTTKEPGSMLARMFSQADDNTWLSRVDETGAYLIDRNGLYAAPIINYLRHGQLILDDSINPAGVLEEAKFFGITSILPQLEQLVQMNVKPTDYTPINRQQMSLSLMTTPASCELRCQGLNFSGADLSKLDLRFVNFKCANLVNTNLAGANLSNANFERAEMSNSILDGANMMGAKLLCAQLEGASMKGCNFEDPAGSRANMEGANLKHVNLEGSHMAGVNLRVATLKNSKLRNCDLRGAVLAGADLENCDLTGCDLQEANLRGANLEGAAFAMMLNALHMSQTLR